jgi:hypothetical protein
MYFAGNSPDIALAYISIGSSFVVGLAAKTERQEGAGSERVARPSFWGWVANDKTQINECLLRLLLFPSLVSNDGKLEHSWIDQIIEDASIDQNTIQERVWCVLDIVSRFSTELSVLVEVTPKDVSLGSGLPGRGGFSTSYVSVDGPCLRDLLRIALKECGSWIDDNEALIGSFGKYRSGGLTTYRVDRYSDKNGSLENEKIDSDDGIVHQKGWGALKWWK